MFEWKLKKTMYSTKTRNDNFFKEKVEDFSHLYGDIYLAFVNKHNIFVETTLEKYLDLILWVWNNVQQAQTGNE